MSEIDKKDKFKEPNVRINKVYTKTGDKGKTSLVGGQRIYKDNIRIEAYGEVDELNCVIGGCYENIRDKIEQYPQLDLIYPILNRIQHELFNLGTILATLPKDVTETLPKITKDNVKKLEHEIDFFNRDLHSLNSFVLPGGSKSNIWFHLARTICRKAERRVVSLSKEEDLDIVTIEYLNRLSDALFVYSRWVNKVLGCEEILWNPNNF